MQDFPLQGGVHVLAVHQHPAAAAADAVVLTGDDVEDFQQVAVRLSDVRLELSDYGGDVFGGNVHLFDEDVSGKSVLVVVEVDTAEELVHEGTIDPVVELEHALEVPAFGDLYYGVMAVAHKVG